MAQTIIFSFFVFKKKIRIVSFKKDLAKINPRRRRLRLRSRPPESKVPGAVVFFAVVVVVVFLVVVLESKSGKAKKVQTNNPSKIQ